MSDHVAERRAYERYALILIAQVIEISSGTELVARTSDISRLGCYVDTLNPLPVRSAVRP